MDLLKYIKESVKIEFSKREIIKLLINNEVNFKESIINKNIKKIYYIDKQLDSFWLNSARDEIDKVGLIYIELKQETKNNNLIDLIYKYLGTKYCSILILDFNNKKQIALNTHSLKQANLKTILVTKFLDNNQIQKLLDPNKYNLTSLKDYLLSLCKNIIEFNSFKKVLIETNNLNQTLKRVKIEKINKQIKILNNRKAKNISNSEKMEITNQIVLLQKSIEDINLNKVDLKSNFKTSDIYQLVKLNYEQACKFLQKKYGIPEKNYFSTPECKSKSAKISRANEGLYIHHIDEDKAVLLSSTEQAIKNPWEYQLNTRLVYCNLLEHLVLHYLIVKYPNPKKNSSEIVGIGGCLNFLIPSLNDIYSNKGWDTGWRLEVKKRVINLKDEFELVKDLLSQTETFQNIVKKSFPQLNFEKAKEMILNLSLLDIFKQEK